MSNEPKWKWKWNSQCFINPQQEQVHPVWAADHINRLESEVERLKSRLNATHVAAEQLQSDLARCKADRLELINALDNLCKSNPLGSSWDYAAAFDKSRQLIVAFRASQLNADQTQEGNKPECKHEWHTFYNKGYRQCEKCGAEYSI